MAEEKDEKLALLEGMQSSAVDFALRGARTRRAFHRGEHRQLLSKFAAESRQRLKEFTGEEEGETDGGSNAGTTGDNAVVDGGKAHAPRAESGG